MRNITIVIVLLLWMWPAFAQETSLRLIATAGRHVEASNGSVSFSIGEPVIGLLSGGGFTVNQGFQQGDQAACSIPGFNPFQDTLRVNGDSILLEAGLGFSSYLWSDGSRSPSLWVKSTGLYSIQVTDTKGCSSTDRVLVDVLKAEIRQNDTTICLGSELVLSAKRSFSEDPQNQGLPANLQNDLIAWYPLNGDPKDFSRNANHGTVFQGPTVSSDRFGNPSGSFYFNGVSGHIQAPHIDLHNSLPLTIACWMKTGESAKSSSLVNKYFSGTWNGWQLYTGPPYRGEVHPWYINGRENNVMGWYENPPFFDSTIYDDRWHHIAFTVDSSGGKLYVDGVLKATQGWRGSPKRTVSTYPLHIGWYPPRRDAAEGEFKGNIDDVYLFGKALTLHEVYQLQPLIRRYRWSTGDTTPTITVKPDKTTTYYLTVSNGISSGTDSVTVRVASNNGQPFDPFPNSIYSRADSLRLDAGAGYTTYKWSTGASSQAIHVKTTGLYKVTVTSPNVCAISDSVFVQFPDTVGIHLPTAGAACNDKILLPVKASGFRYIQTMQGSINWNANDLKFERIQSYGPAALELTDSNFGTNRTGSGFLSFSWNDRKSSGVSLADSTILFTIEFSILSKTSKSIPVKLGGIPTAIEFTDIGGIRKSVVATGGAVNVDCDIVVSGRVLSTTDQGLRNVTLSLVGATSTSMQATDDSGYYRFKVPGGSYLLTPGKAYEKDRKNGISTLDIAQIQSHILFKTPFNAAYKAIAADANQNSSVTTLDIVTLRRLILGIDTALPNNRIWAYVDADQTFANPANPFPYNASRTLTSQFGNVSQSFRGIKIGDVNYDRNPMLDQAPSGDTLNLFYTWTDTDDGRLNLRLHSRAIDGLMGWQTTLRWDPRQLELEGASSLMTDLGSGDRWKEDGRLTMSWNDPRATGLSVSDGMTWMELRFRKTGLLDRTTLSLTEDRLATEAFNSVYQRVEVRLKPAEIRGGEWLGIVRVYPNPASRMVNVEWKSERRGEATVRLLDATGRVVYSHRGLYEAGLQRHVIHRSGALSNDGTWLVQVEQAGKVVNRSVVMAGREPSP